MEYTKRKKQESNLCWKERSRTMLERSLVEQTLQQALSTGGDFAEIFMENTKKSSLSMVNGRVEKAMSGIDYGVGLRIFHGKEAIYTYTNDTSVQGMKKLAEETASVIKGRKNDCVLNLKRKEVKSNHLIKIMPETVEKRRKVDLLRQASQTAFDYHNAITQTRAGYLDLVQDVFIANSEGLWVEDRRVRTRFNIEAVASSDSEKQSGRFSPGGHMGFELFDLISVDALSKEAARIAVTMLHAKPCPSGKMPVIIENGFGGVIFHEACGHGLEATSVAKNASVFSDKMGQKIASDLVTAIDDGTIPNGWGSENIDDEGSPSQKTVLIENGVLKSFLVDRLNGQKMGVKSTGSARRESYRFAPTSRMTNTYLAPGDSTLEQMISSTEFGLYAKQMGGGSVDPATGVFNFAVLEGYLIRNGKIAEPVRGATLIGKGSDVLFDIDMVGSNLARAQGMCGSISGSVPVDVGQPAIRVKEMTVGGRA